MMAARVPLYAPITYVNKQPSGGLPPGQDRQRLDPVPDYWYLVQTPGVGAVSEYHQNAWFNGPFTTGYSPQPTLKQKVFTSGPPLDQRAYDLPLTTTYNSQNPGGC